MNARVRTRARAAGAAERGGGENEPRYPTVVVHLREEDAEDVSVALFDLGATGVETRDSTTLDRGGAAGTTLVAHFDAADDADVARAHVESLGHAAVRDEIVGDAWRDAWKVHFKPQRHGKRLVVRPTWEPFDAGPKDAVVVLDPGRAFGSGLHASTALVLSELDRRVRGGERVLDVGCGSGILGIAALALGARSVVAVDNDPEAVEVTTENARDNGVATRLRARLPPLPRAPRRSPARSPLDSGRSSATASGWDLVVANIQADVLVALSDALARRVAPGGLLVLSGVLVEQGDEVQRAFRGMRTVARPTRDGWVALVLRKRAT